jgi:hypothetical protein
MRIPPSLLGLTDNISDTGWTNGKTVGEAELENPSRPFVLFLNRHGQLELVQVVWDRHLVDHEAEGQAIDLDRSAFLLRNAHRI